MGGLSCTRFDDRPFGGRLRVVVHAETAKEKIRKRESVFFFSLFGIVY
jgi:hypothetical protein